ncbi:dTDP-4-dehydrorhamnose 3,5-epimerase family protein [Streptomyces sp. CA-278952]|uniref:dTDP-4-dehydrorhamnose 3,5-epimerase family protein n=1 Tax=unclassified Streptomyces TaxID=2593676 RepID=UPI0022429C6B|nr:MULTISPECIES: dTDP-4-dehydrorhamnose 3,5-epimerase family protein [unclassified Streptomyces]UZI32608.1 dTDP-4-dehydrorhamnose 3,5-epimerase family protein [Streptomyces sp. VB1]WDG32543.1 dTDP-4-dehydrorhamnose 3,5-epimerase family protein [Streptomyces sp. CA-278952]
MPAEFRPLNVEGAFAFTPKVFPDERGLFVSPYQEEAFEEAVGHRLFHVAQTNHSLSSRGVVRGVHYTTTPPGVAKYVYCPRGRALDIIVDIRVGSPTFGQWDAVELDPASFRTMYFPVGVGHAFVALEDDTVMSYMISGTYVAEHELALSPLDPALGLPIPDDITPLLSERDAAALTLEQARERGLLPDYAESRRIEATLHG